LRLRQSEGQSQIDSHRVGVDYCDADVFIGYTFRPERMLIKDEFGPHQFCFQVSPTGPKVRT